MTSLLRSDFVRCYFIVIPVKFLSDAAKGPLVPASHGLVGHEVTVGPKSDVFIYNVYFFYNYDDNDHFDRRNNHFFGLIGKDHAYKQVVASVSLEVVPW